MMSFQLDIVTPCRASHLDLDIVTSNLMSEPLNLIEILKKLTNFFYKLIPYNNYQYQKCQLLNL